MSYLIVFLILSFLVVIHEAGHLAAARAVGIPVDSFSVGLGPKLWARRWRRVEYCLRAVPLGGFVLPAVAQEEDWRAIPLWKRLLYFLGGPLANVLAVLPGLTILQMQWRGLPLFQAVLAAGRQLVLVLAQVPSVVASLFTHPASVSGAIGIVARGGQAHTPLELLAFAAELSLSLAVLNLLPIPVLDGGQILLGCMEKLFPRAQRLRVPLTVAGLVFLAAVMIFFNLRDVVRLASPHAGV